MAERALNSLQNGTQDQHFSESGGISPMPPSLEADPSLESLLEGPQFKPRTKFRIFRGSICLLVLFWTSFMMLAFLAPFCCLIVRIFSRHYSRQLVAFFFGRWLSMWPFLFENINGTKVVFSGHRLSPNERVMVICNHRTEVDWMYLWNLAIRKGRIGYVKYVVKKSARNIPVFGWALYAMEFLLIDRKWELDEPVVNNYVSSFEETQDPLWLILFPEGTDYTEQKKIANQKYAEEKGLKKLNHVLIPRTRGFLSCISRLHESLDAVYDLTIAYKHRYPLFVSNVLGTDPAEVHIHIQRIPVDEVPLSEKECTSWLYTAYEKKDQLLSDFYRTGSFPDADIEDGLRIFDFVTNFVGIILGTALLTYITLFTSIWIKVYVGLGCLYLTIATHYNLRPSGRGSIYHPSSKNQ